MSEYGFFHGAELFNYKNTKEPIIEHFLYEKDIMCIKAKEGVGKTQLVLQIASCLCSGIELFNTFKVNKKNKVLYIQSEGDRNDTLDRLNKLINCTLVSKDNLLENFYHVNTDGLALNTAEGIAKLLEQAGSIDVKYDVIILDPLYMTLDDTVNNDKVATAWCKNIRYFKNLYGAAMIIAHHEPKDSFASGGMKINKKRSIIGSYVWGGFFNSYYTLEEDKARDIHYLENGKQRSGQLIEKITIKMVDKGNTLLFSMEEEDIDVGEIKIRKVFKETPNLHWKEVAEKTEMCRASVFKNLARLCNNGEIVKTGGGNYSSV